MLNRLLLNRVIQKVHSVQKKPVKGHLLPILPAVVNAVYDAIGIRLRDLPLTPDVVFKGIEKTVKRSGVDDPSRPCLRRV
jgi:hypothetical protein